MILDAVNKKILVYYDGSCAKGYCRVCRVQKGMLSTAKESRVRRGQSPETRPGSRGSGDEAAEEKPKRTRAAHVAIRSRGRHSSPQRPRALSLIDNIRQTIFYSIDLTTRTSRIRCSYNQSAEMCILSSAQSPEYEAQVRNTLSRNP
jgi:hypothetical protein